MLLENKNESMTFYELGCSCKLQVIFNNESWQHEPTTLEVPTAKEIFWNLLVHNSHISGLEYSNTRRVISSNVSYSLHNKSLSMIALCLTALIFTLHT